MSVRADESAIAVDLVAVLVAVTGSEPRVMTVRGADMLPSGPLEQAHRSLQSGLRAWVETQTGQPLGYLEQLYTFADRDRAQDAGRMISISYLGLTREGEDAHDAHWRSWYEHFPWEDHRRGVPALVSGLIRGRLVAWADMADGALRAARRQRAAIAFAFDGEAWNEELVLQRYELLYETGLILEAQARGAAPRRSATAALPSAEPAIPGRAMAGDHRRILATGIARLRAKIKYRPVVFELMPASFTLLQLQRSVEALAGRLLHKQNFRRLIEQQELVEETGAVSAETGGRPAKLFRFRQSVLAERAVAGSKLPLIRT